MSFKDNLKTELETGKVITQDKLHSLIDNVPEIYFTEYQSFIELGTTGRRSPALYLFTDSAAPSHGFGAISTSSSSFTLLKNNN